MQTLSHPVDVVPSMRVPAHLPLEDGAVTCATCHDAHSADGTTLRGSGDLCAECHSGRWGSGYGDMHALALRRAHPGSHDAPPAGSVNWKTGPDPESGTCLGCHDGAVASRGEVQMIGDRPGPFTAARLIGGRHSIGVRQAPRGTGDTLVPADRLDPAIRLFDGRVGCGSCHSLYADNEALLVMENHASRLCLECHDF
jgi:predicted CXXCH cytochrome family protein